MNPCNTGSRTCIGCSQCDSWTGTNGHFTTSAFRDRSVQLSLHVLHASGAFGVDHVFLEREALLTYEEITVVVRSLLPAGLRKVRLTGGEPLLRKDITALIEMLRDAGPDLDLALTTNGASRTVRNGPERSRTRPCHGEFGCHGPRLFQRMADTTNHGPDDVWTGIEAAMSVGSASRSTPWFRRA